MARKKKTRVKSAARATRMSALWNDPTVGADGLTYRQRMQAKAKDQRSRDKNVPPSPPPAPEDPPSTPTPAAAPPGPPASPEPDSKTPAAKRRRGFSKRGWRP